MRLACSMVDSRCAMTMRGAALHQRLERGLHVALRFGVERRSCFIEDQYRRVLQQRARDGKPLPLPAGKSDAVLADECGKPLRHVADEFHARVRLARAQRFRLPCVSRMAPYAILAATLSLNSTTS